MSLQRLIDEWSQTGGSERANKDSFLNELADVLGVARPDATTGDPDKSRYVFEHNVPTSHEGGKVTKRRVDLYKHGCFILEAKQGSNHGDKKLGFARRGTTQWEVGMRDAYGQALGYAASMDEPPPFLIICDIGYCFDIYATFDHGIHRPFPNALNRRIYLRDLTKTQHFETLRNIWADPHRLDPTRHAAKVTRAVAERVAKLARSLEEQGHSSELVAKFLMRCLFTMFAEDIGLLPARTFTKLVKEHWLPNPPSFVGPGGVSSLWKAMNAGTVAPVIGKILRFNGGLFADTTALPLKRTDLEMLLDAAEHDWCDVEPAIFGTLLERALDPKERHMLGAHFTPRAYVERLVRSTIEEPLRAEWENLQAEVRQIVLAAGPELVKPALTEEEYLRQGRGTKAQRAAVDKYLERLSTREAKLDAARAILRGFHEKLASTRVLDPACGTGNFLYVALDLFKRIESEILAALRSVGVMQETLAADALRVTPGQFLGIEVKPWAKEIAEMVLWIGYLQWHYRTHGKALPPPEPVLIDYKNIECRDAVLASDRVEVVTDAHGKPVTRWDGETYKKSPVTGEMVPDETARIQVHRYVNPRRSEWPKADYIVGNPPFIGNKRMRAALGDGYVEALRAVYDDVPDAADYVMYWWHRSASLVRRQQAHRFGLITTNSIVQSFNRRIVADHLVGSEMSIVFAVPDHPWTDSESGAAVRISMTSGAAGARHGLVRRVVSERSLGTDAMEVSFMDANGVVHPDLTTGADVASARSLLANSGLAYTGMYPLGQGFVVLPEQIEDATGRALREVAALKPFYIARDLTQHARRAMVIDFYPRSEDESRKAFPHLYQWVLNRVKPQRDLDRNESRRRNWWLFTRPVPPLRRAVSTLSRYILVPRTAKHFTFHFRPVDSVPDTSVVAIASDDAFVLGVLSSRPHLVWAVRAGGRLGVGNDTRYQHASTFNPFPFPACTADQQQRIRDLGEVLDAHRKHQQAQHPDLTITGMYNVLEKLRTGENFTDKDRTIHEHGLVSVMKKVLDDLDAAVLAAYGWPSGLTDEQILEKIVTLNVERAEEESRKRPLIRWLRPEFQNHASAKPATQDEGVDDEDAPTMADDDAAPESRPWPKKLAEKIAAVRDRVSPWGRAATVAQVASAFTRAPRKDVEEILDSLAAVGVLVELEGDGQKRWGPMRQAA